MIFCVCLDLFACINYNIIQDGGNEVLPWRCQNRF